MTRREMIDEAVRRAPPWAQQHLIDALFVSTCPCRACEAAAEAIRTMYRHLALKSSLALDV